MKANSNQLSVAAYDEELMPALRLARSSRFARRVAILVVMGLLITMVAMAFVMWQQTVTGTGSVIAYAPTERQQVIEAPIKGRISRFRDDLVENSFIKKGEFIAEITDLDQDYAFRLQQQLLNSKQAAAAAHQQLESAHSAVESAHLVLESMQNQVAAYTNVKAETIAAQDAYVEFAEKKVFSARQQLVEYEAALPQLQAELDRLMILQKEGNISLQKVQEVQAKLAGQNAKVAKAKADVEAAMSELEGKQRDRLAKIEKAQVDIDYATGVARKATQDIAKAKQEVAKATQEVNKAEKDVLEAEVKL
ncbi:MAG: toxin secretion protein, partial [Planctomycetaceae bacterium]|nr:toxin secretion protein [Planctomycetaceae bacterium]